MKITFVREATGTERSCAVCLQPATHFGYAADQNGAINKSSRTPLCRTHAVISE